MLLSRLSQEASNSALLNLAAHKTKHLQLNDTLWSQASVFYKSSPSDSNVLPGCKPWLQSLAARSAAPRTSSMGISSPQVSVRNTDHQPCPRPAESKSTFQQDSLAIHIPIEVLGVTLPAPVSASCWGGKGTGPHLNPLSDLPSHPGQLTALSLQLGFVICKM